jgi:hypothetical protein
MKTQPAQSILLLRRLKRLSGGIRWLAQIHAPAATFRYRRLEAEMEALRRALADKNPSERPS